MTIIYNVENLEQVFKIKLKQTMPLLFRMSNAQSAMVLLSSDVNVKKGNSRIPGTFHENKLYDNQQATVDEFFQIYFCNLILILVVVSKLVQITKILSVFKPRK